MALEKHLTLDHPMWCFCKGMGKTWILFESHLKVTKSFSSTFFWLHFILNWWYTFINIQVYAYGSNFIGFPQRDVRWNCSGSLKVVAAILVKFTFGENSEFFWKLYSQNDAERIFLIPVCVAHKLITPHSKSGSYFVKKGKWLMHTSNCRNQASRSLIDLTGTTLTEDLGHCTQLRRLQLPFKMIIVLWFSFCFLSILLVRVELRRQMRTYFLCVQDTESLDYIFPPCHIEKSGLFDLSIRTDFIQPYLIGL